MRGSTGPGLRYNYGVRSLKDRRHISRLACVRPRDARALFSATVCTALLLLGAQPAAAIVPRVGRILLLDQAGPNGPTIYSARMSPETGNTLSTIGGSAEFGDAAAIAWGPRKKLYVASRDEIAPRIVRYDPYATGGGGVTQIYEHPYLGRIADLVSDGGGGLYVLDAIADPLGEGYVGAIFHLDPDAGTFTQVISAPHFTAPAGLAVESDGRILVLDPSGRMEPGGPLRGAIYRVDPVAHTIEALTALDEITVRPEAIELLDDETLLLLDSNLIVPGMSPAGGGILKIATATMTVQDTLALFEFGDPSDLAVDTEGAIVVMDTDATVHSGKLLFRIDAQTGELLGNYFENPLFSQLRAVEVLGGPDLDGSTYAFTKVNGLPPLNPGDRVRFSGVVENTGVAPTGDFSLAIQFGSLAPLLGTQSASIGELSFDPASNALQWDGSLEPGESNEIEITLRISEYPENVGELSTLITATGEWVQHRATASLSVYSATQGGDVVVCDPGVPGSPTLATPRIFRRVSQTQSERVFWDPVLLPWPADLAYGTDGLLYVLDSSRPNNRILRIDPREPSTATVIFEGAPLQLASAICVGHDGSLLVADPKVSFGSINIPGVIYRLDPVTLQMAEFFADSTMLDPVDIVQDTEGGYIVCDYREGIGGEPRPGYIFELDGQGVPRRPVALRHNLIKDPVSATVTADHTIYIADARYDSEPDRGAVIRVRRPSGPGGSSVNIAELIGEENALLVEPHGIEVLDLDNDGDETDILICDRKPINAGGKRAVYQLLEEDGTYGDLLAWVLEDSIRAPYRIARRELPRAEVVSLEIEDASGDEVEPGDVLEVSVVFQNPSQTPVLDIAARLEYPSSLTLLDFTYDDSRGVMFNNPSGRALHWSGDLPYIHPVLIEARFQVGETVPNREQIEVDFLISGLEFPVRETSTVTVSAPLSGGELVVLDTQADPFGTGNLGGTLYLVDLQEETLIPYYADVAEETAADIQFLAADELLVVDKTTETFSGTGAILKLDLRTESRTVWAYHSEFAAPSRLVRRPDGGFILMDPASDLSLPPARGALYQINADGSGLDVAAYSRAFRSLADMLFAPDGRLWVADMSADPLGLGGDTGAFFVLAHQPSTGQYTIVDTVASAKLKSPQGLVWLPGEGLLFTDPGWRDAFGETGLRLYDPEADSIRTVATHHELVAPGRMLALSDEEVLIVDQWATGLGNEDGAIFRLDLSTTPPEIGYAATTWGTDALRSLATAPRPQAQIAFFGADEDSLGTWAQRGDTLHCELRIANRTGTREPSAALGVTVSEHVVIDPATAQASSGEISVSTQGLTWEGQVAGWDSVTIRYEARLLTTPGLSAYADQQVEMSTSQGAETARLLTYLSTVINSGEYVVLDKSADPLNLGGAPGAVFRVDIPTSGYARQAVPLLSDPIFITPVDVALVPGSDCDLLIADANAPAGTSNRGAVLRANTRTGRVEVVCQDSTFSEPRALAVVDSTTCYLLDEGADPYELIPGPFAPGAVYRIDLERDSVWVAFSDTVMSTPVDLAVDPATGYLVLIDREAGGSGDHAGRVLKIDPFAGTYEIIREGDPFVGPRAIGFADDGSLRLIDYKAGAANGTIYALDYDGSYEALARISSLRLPTGLFADHLGHLLITDSHADPAAFGGATGTVFRYSGTGTEAELFLSGPPLNDPRAVDSFYDPVPVTLSAFELSETIEGVRLSWRAPSELAHADFYVYRRTAFAHQEPWGLLNATRPVRGAGDLTYLDDQVWQGGHFEYVLIAALPSGGDLEFGPLSIEVRLSIRRLQLERVRPNPVRLAAGREGMTIRFQVPPPARRITLDLFDITGRRLVRLLEGHYEAGSHVLLWNGRDTSAAPVVSGVYFLRLEAGARVDQQRFVLIR